MKAQLSKLPEWPIERPVAGPAKVLSIIRRHIAWLVLAIALVASAGGWIVSLKLQDQADRRLIDGEAAAVRATLKERLAVCEEVLRGASGLFSASLSVDRREWRSYFDTVGVVQRVPGVDAMGYIARVPRSDLQAFLAATRSDDAPGFRLRSGSDAAELLVIKFIEPEEDNREILGLDLASSAEQRAVAEECLESGGVVVSPQMLLPTERDTKASAGFLMWLPVYRHGALNDTVEERRANGEGFVYAQFETKRFIAEALRERRLPLQIQLIDRSASDRTLFETGETPATYAPRLTEERVLSLGEQRWILRISSTPEFDAQCSKAPTIVAGVGGLLVSLFLFGIALSLGHRREHAVAIASGMTAKLRRANEQLQREIVDREKAQRSIKDSEALYHSLVESLPLNIVRKDVEGRFTFANQRFCNEVGQSFEKIVGKTEFDLLPSEQAAAHKQEDDRITESGVNLETVQELRLPGEDTRYVQVIKTPVRSGVGDVIGLQTIYWDVTDKHRMEQELQRERDLLHTLLDNIPDHIYFKDEQSRFLRVNQAMLDLFKVEDASEVIGKTDFDFFGQEHARQAYEDEQRIIRTGQPVIGLVEREDFPDGRQHWAWTTKMPMRDSNGRVIGTFGISRDITRMKEAEAELEHERYLLSTLMDNLPDRIYFKDLQSRIIRDNPAHAERLGFKDREGALGKTDFDFFDEVSARRKYEDEQRVIRTGEPITKEEQSTSADGQVTWELSTKMPLRDEKGDIVGTVGISRNITELKLSTEALRKAKDAAEQANQSKSQFLANMSHELRTPLNSIIGFSNVLTKNKELRLTKSELTFLERILANGKHLLELINQILDLSKIEAKKVELHMASVRLDQLVKETIEQQEGLVRERPVELCCDVPDQVAPIRADPDKLKQVLINLIGNALKFTEKGSVTLRLAVAATDHRPVRIDVVDTGIGIAKEKLGAIFQAFQQADTTTARKFGGTGLGLTISKALCQLMGYEIEVSSEEGKGSTFSVVLKSEPEPPGEQRPGAGAAAPSGIELIAGVGPRHVRGKRVLVIDDESDSRTLLRLTLEEFGCVVTEASSGEEGIRLARRLQPHFITVDLMMPRMTGYEVVGAIKSDPDLKHIPVVVVSIVSGEQRGHILGAVDLLQKPVVREELLATLQRNLPRTARRILVVDDDEDARELMRSLLECENFQVWTAVNGRSALEVLNRNPCDLVLLDLMMPEMDGFAFLKEARSDPRYRELPVVVVSAKDLTSQELDELRQNASDVLRKSATFSHDLKAVLRRLLEPPIMEQSAGPAGGVSDPESTR